MTISLLLLNDNNPAAVSVDAAIAAARRPHAGCEAVRSVKLVQSATASGGAAATIPSPLATDPCFEFHEAPVVVAPFSQQPPLTPVKAVAPSSPPLSPLFGAGKPSTTVSTSTLGRLDPPPPLVLLPPPPAFDRLGAAAKLTAPPSPQPLAPAPPLQQRVSLAPMLTEELTVTFRGSGSSGEVRVALRGHVQLGVVATGGASSTETGAEAEALQPLEVDVALSDRAGQVAASAPSPAAAALFVKTEQPPAPSSAAAIPEAKDDDTTLAAMNNDPSPASSSYRCRIPRDRFASSSSSSSLLDLLRYEAKPSVRPVPVRIQQSLVRVEAGKEPGVAHVVAQVAVNPALFMPLVAASFSCQLLVPGLAFGQELLSAAPAAGVSWAPPLLQWALPEELKPGTTLILKASLPLLAIPTTPTPTTTYPLRASFKAQSLKVGLTKVGVHLHPVVSQQGGGGPHDPVAVEVQPPKRRFLVTAKFEP